MSSMSASVKRPQRFNDGPDVLISISAAASERERVDFFRKLGYSPAEVMAALSKLGLSTDTNSMLGELVRSRTGADSDKRNQKYQPPPTCWTPRTHGDRKCEEAELRPIVIDGSNVAMSHGNKEVFSCRGIQLAVNFFRDRGHRNITVFVPAWRKEQPRPDAPITDKNILTKLEKQKTLVFTPSRRVGGRRVVCYDDRFIVKLAHESGGVIVSNDTYRDLQGEKPEWKKCIEERLLMYSFVNDKFMPPDDPLGRHGPSLENFLRTKPLPAEQRRQLCPYDKKCTYGIKCKFYHPERANRSQLSLADELREKAQVSSSKEERNARSSPKQLPPVRPVCPLTQESNTEHKSSSPVNTVSENKLPFDENPRSSLGHVTCPPAVRCQNEWSGLHSLPSHYYAGVPQGYLDSGLGSYDSQVTHAGPLSVPVHTEQKNPSYFCGCGAPSQTPWGNTEGEGQIPCLVLPPRQNSPLGLPYASLPDPQRSYWTDPFQAPHPARTCFSLPTAQPPQPHHSRRRPSANWPDPWQHIPAAADPQKQELQKKLQAIFNPQQVETVMEMFPHVTDAQKLAAEIVNLKVQRGMF